MRARLRPPDEGFRWLWQLSSAGWGHCGLAYASAGRLPPHCWPARSGMPLRDRYSSRRTSLVLFTLAYHKGIAPDGAAPPSEIVSWRNQAWVKA